MEKIDWIKDIENQEIAKIIEQYNKIVWIIKDDCQKRWITFIGYWYFRQTDSIKENDATFFCTHTDITTYDQFFANRSFRNFIF